MVPTEKQQKLDKTWDMTWSQGGQHYTIPCTEVLGQLEAGHDMEPGRDNSVAPTKLNLPSKSPRSLCWSTRPEQTNKNQSSFIFAP